MKLTVILLFTVLLQVNASTFAQKVSINKKNISLEQLFKQIRAQTGYYIIYTGKLLSQSKPISINVTNSSVDDVLQLGLKDQPLSYVIENKTVIIKEKEKSLLDKIRDSFNIPIVVSGRVTDTLGNNLSGVTIKVVGKPLGTITDKGGAFSLNVQDGDALEFTFVGFARVICYVNRNDNNITIVMHESTTSLSETVIVGYGSIKKKDLTGSVSTINVKDIQDVPFGTVDNALAGKAAGVQVTKTDGSPGGAVRIRIRGSSSILGGNDPLYVIDGVPLQVSNNYINPGFDVGSAVGNNVTGNGGVSTGMSTAFVNGLNSIGGLNVDDIESITILKDASSTAIYGSKAANGVVLINTKRGKKDMKPQIVASYYSTVTTPKTPDLLNADQYKLLLSEAAKNSYDAHVAQGRSVAANVTAIVNTPGTYFGTANTNWINEVTRNTISHNADLSVQGGGSASKYFSSISYNSTPGVVKSTDYQRISGKLNIENEIGPKFRFITNLIVGYTNQDIGNGAYDQALIAPPTYAPYNALGGFTDFSLVGASYQNFQNPVAMLTATNNAKTFSLLGSISGIYDITSALQFKSTVSLNMQAYNQRNYTPSYLAIGSFYGNISNNGGIGGNSNSQLTNWFVENTLAYNKTFNKIHAIDILVGTSYETKKTSFFSATGAGYPNDNVLTSLSSAVTPLLVKGDDPSQPQSYLLSFYARANYGLMDKYLITFTGRADGSSKFGPNNKFGYFPSGAVAWRISKEDFLKNVKWIDDIKFRGSYGLTGTQNIGDQMYRTLYSPYSYAGTSALIPTQVGNPDIQWESTKEADAGLDISLFNGRLQATLDYYNKQTSGALLLLPVAPSSSYSSMLSNAVSIKNTGFEVSLQGDIVHTKDFKWNSSINITWNRSLVTKLASNANLGQLGNFTGLEIGNTTLIQGQPLGLITGLHVTGIIKTADQLAAYKQQLGVYTSVFRYLAIGDPMYELQPQGPAGSNYLNFNTIIAHAAPNYFGGFTHSFTYKNFDLNFYFTFSQGGSLLWGDHVSSMEFVGVANANVAMLNRYTPANTSSNQPMLQLGDIIYYKSNLDVFSSSYIKLRTLSFSYRFNKIRWMQKAGMKNTSVFASATNVFTITKYPGNDPETSDDPYSVAGGYMDVSNYPTVKTFSLGIKVGF
ncbi:SusC/RagA family TonB-linked outer membrane protein [Mucilaginibacter sp.]|uniref:SusC/RagA family TonB-linked outer membrane protein n=1 Tax=Mucilaginibacter sp. TaxID=1882438 RepID=UPI002601D04E|nr:SusC/RagA family TonB-linked outer membrane protein [Mucilaginibacter sp.]MDB4925983.1 SusC/RagA family TonB-linked outer membrane protein [Mucilaginibacter sp.]